MEPAVAIVGVTKEFPGPSGRTAVRALDAVSFAITPGETVGLLGPNGSGKSTLLKILLGLQTPTAGTCRLFGLPCGAPRARANVGFLAEAAEFPRFLTARELVVHAGRLGGLERAAAVARADEWLRWAGLAAADRRLGEFSKGMRQRAGLAQALVGDPALVILDEPTTGLDPVGVAEFGRLVRDLKRRGKTVLLCSHHLAQVEELCDRVVVLQHGRVVADETIEETCGPRRLEAFPAGGALERRFLALVHAAAPVDSVVVPGRVRAGSAKPHSSGRTGAEGQTKPRERTHATDAPSVSAPRSAGSFPALSGAAAPASVPAGAESAAAVHLETPRASGRAAAWSASVGRIALLAGQTLREAARQRAPYVVLFLALALVAAAAVVRGFDFGTSELKFLGELGLGTVSLFGSVLAVIVTTQLFTGELERGGAVWLLAKPVRRAEFLAGRFLGTWAALGGFVVVLVALVGAQLAARAYELGAPVIPLAVPLAVAGVALTLKLGVVAAVTLVPGSAMRSPLLALVLALLVVLACHLTPFVHHASRHADAGLVRFIADSAALALPDLAVFDVEFGGRAFGPLAPAAVYAVACIAIFGGVAWALFRRREL